MTIRRWLYLAVVFLQCLSFKKARGFVMHKPSHETSTQLFVFDFFKQRTQEGLDQLNKIADSAYKGDLGKGLTEAAVYATQRNQAFAQGLAASRSRLTHSLEGVWNGGFNLDNQLEDLMDILLQADLGLSTSEDIIKEVKSLRGSTKLNKEDLKSIMRGQLLEALDTERPSAIQFSPDKNNPTILFIMGANGMGKTTTIGKLAHRLRTEGDQSVLVAACDTFRAGAVDQLQLWADRTGVDLVGPTETVKSPSAVLYSALDRAIKGKYDSLLVDTSGRLSNNEDLTAELVKMKKVIQKRMSQKKGEDGKPIANLDVPHETMLVIDAAQGRMALDSAKVWNDELGLTGLILTKLDGSARGGSVVAVSRDLQLPVKLIGIGEKIDDLRDFEPEGFVDGLLGIGVAGGGSSNEEGKMLQGRLNLLRKERDARATAIKSSPPAPSKQVPSTTNASGKRKVGGKVNKSKRSRKKRRSRK